MMEYRVEKLADSDFYTEGPVVGRNGDLFFTTLSGGDVICLKKNPATSSPLYPKKETDYREEVWASGTCPNGQAIFPNGEHWFCESSTAQIAAYHPDGSFKGIVIEGNCGGSPFSTPNDLIVDSKGNIFFTESVRDEGGVFFVGADGNQKKIAGNIDYANGLVLSADEQVLYVAESYRNRILALRLNGSNEVVERQTLIDLPAHRSGDALKNLPDGLARDEEGRIWAAHYGMQALQVVSPGGELLATIDTQLPLTSNLTFLLDTPARKQVLVTGGYGEPGPGAVMLITVDDFVTTKSSA